MGCSGQAREGSKGGAEIVPVKHPSIGSLEAYVQEHYFNSCLVFVLLDYLRAPVTIPGNYSCCIRISTSVEVYPG